MTDAFRSHPAHLWHAGYNRFLCFWDPHLTPSLSQTDVIPIPLLAQELIQQAPFLSHSQAGAAVDGLLVLGPGKHLEEKLTVPVLIINRDGSVAHNCINGLTVAASEYMASHPQTKKISLTVHSPHHFRCQVQSSESSKQHISFTFPSQKVPINGLDSQDIAQAGQNFIQSMGWLSPEDYVGCYHVGNDHFVWRLCAQNSLIRATHRDDYAMLSQIHAHLKQLLKGDQLNVHLCYEKESSQIKTHQLLHIASWERGVGATDSCGSGGVAATLCSIDACGLSSSPTRFCLQGPRTKSNLWIQTYVDPHSKVISTTVTASATFIARHYFTHRSISKH